MKIAPAAVSWQEPKTVKGSPQTIWQKATGQEKVIALLLLTLAVVLVGMVVLLIAKTDVRDRQHTSTSIPVGLVQKDSPCGDWTPYNDEKCYMVLLEAGKMRHETAEGACNRMSEDLPLGANPKLITIKTRDEQNFLEHLLSAQNDIVDNVWLGLRRNRNSSFGWNDGADVTYANWGNESTDTGDGNECAQILLREQGKWSKVSCQKDGFVVCEKMPLLSLPMMQHLMKSMLESRSELKQLEQRISHELYKLKERNEATDNEVAALKSKSEETGSKISEMAKIGGGTANVVSGLLQNYDALAKKLAATEVVNDATSNKLAALDVKYNKVSAKTINMDERINSTAVSLHTSLRNYEGISKQMSEFELAKEALKKAMTDIDQQCSKTSSSINGMEQRNSAMEDTIRALQKNYDAITQRIKSEEAGKELRVSHEKNETSVPIGFIYIQLPGKEPPTVLWPNAKWKDVGSEYSGLFFRVEGGDAAPFGGETQKDNTRRLAQAAYSFSQPHSDPVIPDDGSWSKYAYTGIEKEFTGINLGLRFRLTTGEVRPVNKSVKVWLRIK